VSQGDAVIQNAANSGVGLAAMQLARAWGVASINIVRQRYL
jgi:mitochondrial enoyl-[acyl-carrier protein] reductase / trans-2-enoyl-CoA reductase